MFTKSKRSLIWTICFLVFIVSVFIIFSSKDSDILELQTSNENNTVGPITANNSVKQTFLSDNDGLTRVDLLLATYARNNTSNIFFQITDDLGNIVFTQTVTAESITDNEFYSLDFDTIKSSSNKVYNITISSDSQSDDNAITVWASESDIYKNGNLYINEINTDYDIVFRTFYSSKVSSMKLMLMCLLMFFISFSIALYYNFFYQKIEKKFFKYICWVSSAFFLAFGLTAIYNRCLLDYCSVQSITCVSGMLRTFLFGFPCLFITSFVFFPVKKVADFIFIKRWFLAGIIFVILVAGNFNLSNVSMWNKIVQPNIRSELSESILGVSRSIRSDEWAVSLPRKATSELVGYGSENNIARGTYNAGLSVSGLYLGYSALANPFNWGYYLFGFVRGTSFYWMSIFILAFMSSFELCYILARGQRLYALFGAVIIGLSQFLLWWSIPVNWVAAQIMIVCIYYFFVDENIKHKILFALGVALFGATFSCNLYPAWQVPLAYIIIAFFIWSIFDNLDKIKHFKKIEWLIMGLAFLFMLSLVASYFYDNKFYFENVMNTVYPGQRRDTGGGTLLKAFFYSQSLLYPFKNIGNSSEAGVMFSLFPIPIIIAFSNLVYQLINKLKKMNTQVDILNLVLLIIAGFLFCYCKIGLPGWLAKITLIDYSVTQRAIDVLLYSCVLLLVRNLSVKKTERFEYPALLACGISSFAIIYGIKISDESYLGYMPVEYISFISIAVFLLSLAIFGIFSNKNQNIIFLSVSFVLLITGLMINPVTCGVDALKSKPASVAIQSIVKEDPDAKWIAESWLLSNYIMANGGSCITSTNYIPNMELWTKLDTESKYNKVYNRYAHVNLNFTEAETNFVLIQQDHFLLNLNKCDLKKCEAEYFLANNIQSGEPGVVDFELIYEEDGIYIYKINYL